MDNTSQKAGLLGLSSSELSDALKELGAPSYLHKQIWDWIYKKHVQSFDEMTNISQKLREQLKEKYRISPFLNVTPHPADDGLAIKYQFQLSDCQFVEAVVLNEGDYYTLCISSQCGCPVDCKFCLTGIMGFKRQLTKEEILGQFHRCRSEYPITNIVFMGMGEPLLNYAEVIPSIDFLSDENAFALSKRKITVSTSGYLASIKRLIQDDVHLNLAFSVGHPNPEEREKVMPIEAKNPIHEVSRLLKQYLGLHNRKLTLEYTLLKDVNDDDEAARELGNLAKYLDAKVNLINLNPHPSIPFEPVSKRKIQRFKEILHSDRVRATLRIPKGQDAWAACGQLANLDPAET